MTKTEEMEACPFCGGRPIVRTERGDERNGYAESVTIECSECGGSVHRSDEQPTKAPFYAKRGTGRAAAIAAWNRRPTVSEGLVENEEAALRTIATVVPPKALTIGGVDIGQVAHDALALRHPSLSTRSATP